LKIDPSWLKARVVGCRCVLDGGASFKTAPPSDSIRCWLSLWGRRGSIGCRCGVEERAFSGTVHPLLVGSMQHVLLAVAVGSTWRALFKDRPWLKARVVGCRYMVDKDAFSKQSPWLETRVISCRCVLEGGACFEITPWLTASVGGCRCGVDGCAFFKIAPLVERMCLWLLLCGRWARMYRKYFQLKVFVVGCRCNLGGCALFGVASLVESLYCWLSLCSRWGRIFHNSPPG
jgi:hypothetical protein